jgi:hypothetical protein
MKTTAVRPSRGKNGGSSRVNPKDFYNVLGVKRDASKAEIADTFKRLAFQYHPDRNTGEEANERFAEISRAYAVLHDDEKRELYDALGPDRYDDPWEVYRYKQQREEAVRDAKAWEAEKWERRGGAVNTIIGSILFLALFNALIPAYVLGPWDYVFNGFAILCLIVGIHQLFE